MISNNKIQLDGFNAMYDWLRTLPRNLTNQAQVLVDSSARAAALEIAAAYPRRSGNLARGVGVQWGARGKFVAASRVVNTAPHAFMFEQGTVSRKTSQGWDRGVMPAGHLFVPIVIRHRADLMVQLEAMMEAEELVVSRAA